MAQFNGFFDNFLNSLQSPKGNLGDYQHAARLYVDNNMRLAPKLKHLYHVVFNINPRIKTLLNLQNVFDRNEVNLLVKSVDLPSFNMKTETLNQYNRKKIVQTGVEYQPVNLEFHDDNAGITSFLWESYFRYYYTDSNYSNRYPDGTPAVSSPAYEKIGSLNSMYASPESIRYKYGLDRGGKGQNFFTSIQVFQLHPQNVRPTFTSFTLVNPVIERFQHDKLNQESSEFSTNSMTIRYEAVFYNRGKTRKDIAPSGFASTHYDRTPSSIAGVDYDGPNLFGSDGVLSNVNNAINDFKNGNFLSGVLTSINAYQNARELTVGSIENEVVNILNAPPPAGALSDVVFPRAQESNNETIAIPRFGDF